MSLTPDGGCAKGAIPDQATVSPLRHWRDRGVTTANPSPTHDIDLWNKLATRRLGNTFARAVVTLSTASRAASQTGF